MASQTISWYQECQRNFKRSIDEKILKKLQLTEEIRQDEKRFSFKERQINEAIKQGKEKFDEERFLIKKVRKCQKEVRKR